MNKATPRPLTAVVVNDDPTQLGILCALSAKTGLKPLPFTGAEEALRAMNPEAPPALIVTNLYMPDLDGLRFCRLLRSPEYEFCNEVPILVVSATFAGDHPQRIAADIGADAFLASPVVGKDFTAKARALLEGKQERRLPRALIVEDGKTLAGSLKKAFIAHGYRADTALSVCEAGAAFAETAYDVAVLDHHLPDGTGDALLDAFRARRPDCVCLMMTTDPAPALDWMKQGAAAYLRKPFEPEYLIELCARARRERSLLRTEELLEARTRELRESEAAVCNKLKAVLEPESDLGVLELADMIDVPAVQSLMESFHRITGMVSAIVDNKGNLLVAVGFQDICAKFHRSHPETLANCVESDTILARGAAPGTFKTYRCKNGLWDMASPIAVAGRHLGNIYFGQFRYTDDAPDVERFREQARRYGFGETEYLEALSRVPRYNRETVEEVMSFYSRLAYMISSLSFSAVSLARDITERKRAEDRMRLLSSAVEQISESLIITNPGFEIMYINRAAKELFGYSPEELRGRNPALLNAEPLAQDIQNEIYATVSSGKTYSGSWLNRRRDGSHFKCEFKVTPVFDESGSVSHYIGAQRDVTAQRQAEESLRESEAWLGETTRIARVGGWKIDLLGNTLEWTDETFRIHDLPPGDPPNVTEAILFYHAEDRPSVSAAVQHAVENGEGFDFEARIITAKQNLIWVRSIGHTRFHEGRMVLVWGIIQDITERKRAEEEREKLRAQLAQAQKMESVGRLAGGVAHDFNNMLGVILGHTELALEQVDPGQPLVADLQEVRRAAARSADLTRQLLTFARKQTIAPRVIDLNETVEAMLKMLRRLIGEDIDLAWLPGGRLAPIRVDPSQIDQVLANLCVNARDAIDGVGKVTIETGAAAFDETYCADHAAFAPGEYVMLAVSDNGCGMDSETLGLLFEPFFTTKEPGRGTGLGLAMVYGAVKQNNGFINVYSEPGLGTTFKVYLPRHAAGTVARLPEQAAARRAERGHETILLVEDEPAILRMTTRMLERAGYTVVSAGVPGEAIRLAHEHKGRIDLLMTDVVMPEMNGRDLAGNLLSLYPDMKRLFMSGYTANVIAHHGVLDEGVNFIQKPFSMTELATKIREALDRE